jgi:hypothetical protein
MIVELELEDPVEKDRSERPSRRPYILSNLTASDPLPLPLPLVDIDCSSVSV